MAGAPASSSTSELIRLDETCWEIPAHSGMRVPARVFADEELIAAIRNDRSLEQLENVATLPGIVRAALAMPDIHQGYGFPVGGVAATALPDGVVSPGGCGLRHQLRGTAPRAAALGGGAERPPRAVRPRAIAQRPGRERQARAARALPCRAGRCPAGGTACTCRTRDRPP